MGGRARRRRGLATSAAQSSRDLVCEASAELRGPLYSGAVLGARCAQREGQAGRGEEGMS